MVSFDGVLGASGGLTPFSFPTLLLDHNDYDVACARCEQKRWIGRAERDAFLPLLEYDKRTTQDSSNGLALLQDYPPLDLLKGDRLEPSPELPDVGSIGIVAVWPLLVTFWRNACLSMALHRSPLCSVSGVTILTFAFDVMHTLHGGNTQ